MRQERILLALVETVDLVDEHDGLAALPGKDRRLLDRFADVFDTAQYGADGHELRVEGVRHEPRNGGLAGAWRAPQDATVRPPRFERHAQRLALTEQMLLADHFAQPLRAQTLGKRHVRRTLGQLRHVYWRIRSAPAGGLNTKVSAGSEGLISTRLKVRTER